MQYSEPKKCGRCHNPYTEVTTKVNGVPFEYVVLHTPIRTTAARINLCPDCAQKLFLFLCNEKESEV